MLDTPPIELQLAAAEALARMGRPMGIEKVLEATNSETHTVRSQAAMALGYFREPRAVAALVRLLDDTSSQVRVAAAAGIMAQTRGKSQM